MLIKEINILQGVNVATVQMPELRISPKVGSNCFSIGNHVMAEAPFFQGSSGIGIGTVGSNLGNRYLSGVKMHNVSNS
jgi:hypothetical protein